METGTTPLLILVAVISAYLLLQRWISNRHSNKEGFELVSQNNKNTFGPDRTAYTVAGSQLFNPIMNLIAPTRNTLLPPNFTPGQLQEVQATVRQSVNGAVAKPADPSFKLVPSNVDDILLNPESTGTAIDLVKKCQAVNTTDCSAFSDAVFARSCGICFDGGVDSSGAPKVGGLYISEKDRGAAEYSAKKMGSAKPNYQPSIGQCAPNKFFVSQNQCIDAQRELLCQTQQSFETPGCGQCLQDGKFHYISTDAVRNPCTLTLVGNGLAIVTKIVPSSYVPGQFADTSKDNNSATITLSSTSQSIGLDILEGDTVQITVAYDAEGTIKGNLTVAGYLSGTTASGKFTMDIFPLIPIDTISGGKPTIAGNIVVDTNSCTNIRTSNGRRQMNLALTNPFTFLDPTDEDSIACPVSPYITKAASATILGSSPCFQPGQGPGNYSLSCVQSIFEGVGCKPTGTLYPSTEAAATAISLGPDGTKLSLGGLGNSLAQLYQKASIGKDSGGAQLPINEWDKYSKQCLGIARSSVCDKYDTSGPLGADCLDFLWKNSGQNVSAVGSTYAGSTSLASLFPNTRDNQYCTSKGSMAPINQDGSLNQAAIATAQSKGSISAVKAFYDTISKAANNNSSTDAGRSLAIEQCYGVTLNPQMPVGTDVSRVSPYTQRSVFGTTP